MIGFFILMLFMVIFWISLRSLIISRTATASDFFNGLAKNLQDSIVSLGNNQRDLLVLLQNQIHTSSTMQENKLETMRETLERRLYSFNLSNQENLDKIRATVEEKLHATLEKRMGESFNAINERLEVVHRSIGEMNHLATGVWDLKKVLTNVKTRGIWGEIQLEAIINQILAPEQYGKNIEVIPSSNSRVEYAIRLPQEDKTETPVWLPIDSKLPLDDYHRMIDAHEHNDHEAGEIALKNLVNNIKKSAKTIAQKYIKPPYTTDFALLFLPIEGLYAELLRHPEVVHSLQEEYRVIITGPSTFSAILNSLQMGFKTVSIRKHSTEVWRLLSAIKQEFGKFSGLLGATKQKLEQASKAICDAQNRSQKIERCLQNVEMLEPNPATDAIDYVEED